MAFEQFLGPIGMVESSGGWNFGHAPVTSGAQAGTHAIGTYGLMPRTILGLAAQSPEDFPELAGASEQDIYRLVQGGSGMERQIAEALAGQLHGQFGGNEEAMALGWYSGPEAGKRHLGGGRLTPDEQSYLQKYQGFKGQNASPSVAPRQPLGAGAKRALGHPSYQGSSGSPEPPHGWPAAMPDRPIDWSTGLRPPSQQMVAQDPDMGPPTMPFDFPQRPEYEGLLGTEGRQAAAAQLRALLDDEGPGSTKMSRTMDVIGQSLAGLAAGGAASTNYPVWQKAHAITQDAQRDRWMRDKDSAQARVQRRDDLMDLMQRDEVARSGQASRDPQMVEVNGQMVPLQVALDQHNIRLRSGLERGNIEAGKEADFERMERGKEMDSEKEMAKQAAITARATANREYAVNYAASNARRYGIPAQQLQEQVDSYLSPGRGYVDYMGQPIPPWTHDKISEKAAQDLAHLMTLANPQAGPQRASAAPPAGQDWITAPPGGGNYRSKMTP